jgi:hypothetical protein
MRIFLLPAARRCRSARDAGYGPGSVNALIPEKRHPAEGDPLETKIDLLERLAALEGAVRAADEQRRDFERRFRAATRRARLAGAVALVAAVGAAAWTASPEARAQVGVTLASLNARLNAVEAKTAPISVAGTSFIITGKNVFIQDGSGQTDGGTGLGNLTVGYNPLRNSPGLPDVRTGTHNLIVGTGNNYTSFGGLVVGVFNEISAPYAVVCGGGFNTASGLASTVSGGSGNTASDNSAAVSGGSGNTASGLGSSVSGGSGRSAPGALNWAAGGLFQAD